MESVSSVVSNIALQYYLISDVRSEMKF